MNSLVRFALVALFPREGDWPGLADLGVDEQIERVRRESTWLFWLGLCGAAFFFQISPLLTSRRPVLAAWLDEEELDAHAHALATHRLYLVRQITVLLKLVGGMFWGQAAEIREKLALPPYPGDPGTRRAGPVVPRPALLPRAPGDVLVQIGRKEESIGRGREHDRAHALDVEAV